MNTGTMTILINENILLELTGRQHAKALFHAVNTNRRHLAAFLPWVDKMQCVENFEEYLEYCTMLYQQKKEVSFVIMWKEEAVGRIGLHHIDQQNRTASIGYWLTKKAQGHGIMSQSCTALIDYGFNELHLHRIEIKAAVSNTRSRHIPEKLGFTEEGILREAELVNGRYLDLVLYPLLKREWEK